MHISLFLRKKKNRISSVENLLHLPEKFSSSCEIKRSSTGGEQYTVQSVWSTGKVYVFWKISEVTSGKSTLSVSRVGTKNRLFTYQLEGQPLFFYSFWIISGGTQHAEHSVLIWTIRVWIQGAGLSNYRVSLLLTLIATCFQTEAATLYNKRKY